MNWREGLYRQEEDGEARKNWRVVIYDDLCPFPNSQRYAQAAFPHLFSSGEVSFIFLSQEIVWWPYGLVVAARELRIVFPLLGLSTWAE